MIRLVADIGGTNSRFALSEAGQIIPDTAQGFANADWASLDDLVGSYLAVRSGTNPGEMVMAVAGPVQDTRAVLTNRDWMIDTGKLATRFGFRSVHLFNDLTALGYAVPNLKSGQLRKIDRHAHPLTKTSQSLVVGIGTGFNVSPVLQSNGAVFCPAVEAGHVSMPLVIETILQDMGFDAGRYPSVEDLFSGRGFSDFCGQTSNGSILDGRAAILKYGAAGQTDITSAVDKYAMLLGYLLRELSLAYMPLAGVYIAGSVGRSILEKAPSHCIKVLEEPRRIRVSTALPMWVIEDDAAALTGCAGYSFQ